MPIIAYFLVSFLAGVGIRSFLSVPANWTFGGIGLAGGLLIVLIIYRKFLPHPPTPSPFKGEGEEKRDLTFQGVRFITVLFMLLVFFLGIIRLDFYERKIEDDKLHLYYGKEIVLEGLVYRSVPKTNSQQLFVETSSGNIRIVTGPFPKYRYGDEIILSGKVEEPKPFGNIDTPKRLAKDLVYSEMIFPVISNLDENFLNKPHPPTPSPFKGEGEEKRDPTFQEMRSWRGLKIKLFGFLYTVKESFEEKIQLILPEPHASLANGMLLGNEGALSADLKDAFRKSGTIHILVLSGYNITIVGLFFLAMFSFIKGGAWQAVLAASGIILFTLMTGAEPPAVRAAIMALIALLALKTGRQNLAWLALLWSGFFMVLWNPMLLFFDGSFQLSFLATLGLIVMSPWFTNKLSRMPNTMFVKESVIATLSAQIFVLPLIISWGSEISFLSPLANVVVAGLVPYVMFFGFVGALAGYMSLFLGKAIASVAYIFISIQIFVAETISSLDLALFHLNYLPSFVLILVYGTLFYFAWYYISRNN